MHTHLKNPVILTLIHANNIPRILFYTVGNLIEYYIPSFPLKGRVWSEHPTCWLQEELKQSHKNDNKVCSNEDMRPKEGQVKLNQLLS